MDQRSRRGFTAAEKTELWERWQRGESLKAIGRAFGKPSSSIYNHVAPHGAHRAKRRHADSIRLSTGLLNIGTPATHRETASISCVQIRRPAAMIWIKESTVKL